MRRSGCECTTMDDYDKEDEEDGGENAMVNCEWTLIGVGPRKLVVGYLELKHNRPITIDTASEVLRVDKKCLFSSGPQRCGHYKKLFQGRKKIANKEDYDAEVDHRLGGLHADLHSVIMRNAGLCNDDGLRTALEFKEKCVHYPVDL